MTTNLKVQAPLSKIDETKYGGLVMAAGSVEVLGNVVVRG